jgi:hypothetical protein
LTSLILALLAALPLAAAPSLVEGPSTLVYPAYWHTPMGLHRGTESLLRALLGPQARFADPRGLACAHLAEQGGDDDQLCVLGVNAGAGQLVYNPDGASLASYGSFGSGEGQFKSPCGVAMLSDGRVAVADTGNQRVALLRLAGGRLSWRGSLGPFKGPTWVAYGASGRLWVSEPGADRILCFSPAGRPLAGIAQGLTQPQALAVREQGDASFAPGPGACYVVDQYHSRVSRYSLDGRLQARLSIQDCGFPLAYLEGLALDYNGNVYVTDRANACIHKFSPDLGYLDSWGSPGSSDGHLDQPRGIALYRPYGQLLVLERDSAQYLWLGVDIKGLRLARQSLPQGTGFLRADFKLTERASMEAWLEDSQARPVKQLAEGLVLPAGANALTWDGTLAGGRRAPSGRYTLVLKAQAMYSSRGAFAKQARASFLLR